MPGYRGDDVDLTGTRRDVRHSCRVPTSSDGPSRRAVVTGTAIGIGAVLAGCGSRGDEGPAAPSDPTSTSPSSSPRPLRTLDPPFTDSRYRASPVRLAVLRTLFGNPAEARWQHGAAAQAAVSGLSLEFSVGSAGEALAGAVRRAVEGGADAVLVDVGVSEGDSLVEPAIRSALDGGTPVAAYNLSPNGVPAMPVVLADDAALTVAVVERMAADLPPGASVMLVGPAAGYSRLDRRVEALGAAGSRGWRLSALEPDVADHLGASEVDSSINRRVLAAAFATGPRPDAVFAVNAVLAATSAGGLTDAGLSGSVRLYAVVDHALDPALLTAADSPWVAAAMTDPAHLGAASVRTAALALAGDVGGEGSVTWVGGAVVDAAVLRAGGAATPDDVYRLLPAPQPAVTAATAEWLPDALT